MFSMLVLEEAAASEAELTREAADSETLAMAEVKRDEDEASVADSAADERLEMMDDALLSIDDTSEAAAELSDESADDTELASAGDSVVVVVAAPPSSSSVAAAVVVVWAKATPIRARMA